MCFDCLRNGHAFIEWRRVRFCAAKRTESGMVNYDRFGPIGVLIDRIGSLKPSGALPVGTTHPTPLLQHYLTSILVD
jgi:hypothetical protein